VKPDDIAPPRVSRAGPEPEPEPPPALVLDLFRSRPPSGRLVGVVRDLVPACAGHPRPDDDPLTAA
jgi:hypothetical protein